MTQTQRWPVPLTDSGELDTALAFLTFNRESVLEKTGGLDEEQPRRVLVPTGTNLLGLISTWPRTRRESNNDCGPLPTLPSGRGGAELSIRSASSSPRSQG
ncbi:MAG: DUF664 domain-containing protein [Candidatus Dormibacteria bacterium]